MRVSLLSPLLLVLVMVSSATAASLSRQKRTIGPVSLGRVNFIGRLHFIILTVALRIEVETITKKAPIKILKAVHPL